MKRLGVLFLLVLSFGLLAHAQDSVHALDSTQKHYSLKVNVLPLIFLSFNAFGEARLIQGYSICLGVNYWYSKKGTLVFNRFDQQHLGFTTEFRKYADNMAIRGFYWGGYFKYRHVLQQNVVNFIADSTGANSIETPAQDQNWDQIGLGAMFGYQHIFPSGFLVESFAGLGYYFYSKLKTDHPEWLTDFSKASRMDLRVGISLGYAF